MEVSASSLPIIQMHSNFVATEEIKSPESARIWKKHEIEKDGHVLGDGDAHTLLPGDFTLPKPDVIDQEDLEVKLTSLELFASIDSQEESVHNDITPALTDVSEMPEIKNFAAMMKFSVKYSHGIREMDFALEHDVHFVTAHPCIPTDSTKLLLSPTSPTFNLSAPSSDPAGSVKSPHELYQGMHPPHYDSSYR